MMMTRLQYGLLVALLSGVLVGMSATVKADEYDSGPMMGMMGGMGRGMMGGGMGGGMGMMHGMPYQMLNLTDDQRTRINKLTDEERRKHWETMGKIMDERARMRDLYAAEKRDTQAILRVQEQIDQLQRKMLELHLNTRNQADALLTKEQRDQLKSMGPGNMGPGMMGPGGGMGMGRGMMR